MKFEMLKDKSSIIKVIGVGGGGGNAVNHMYNQGIIGVDFIICNTDAQALELSPIPNKVQLGMSLTEGRGAGSIPDVGKNSAIESIDDIKDLLGSNTKMVFITAGMGGGTGTGASPIICQAAKELGILTVGIVTTPFNFEGKQRKIQADEGLEALKKHVDTLLVISNDKLREMYGNLTLSKAFAEADNILTTAAKGIAEIITVPGYINVDFEDVKTVMANSGVAIMGSASAEGEGRAYKAVQEALASPLLNNNDIEGARYILLNITSGAKEVLMDEVSEITDYIQNQAGLTADIIWGNCYDETLGDKISVTLIATGFQTKTERIEKIATITERKVIPLTIQNQPEEVAEEEIVNEVEIEKEVAEVSVEAKFEIQIELKENFVIAEKTAEGLTEIDTEILEKAPPMVLKSSLFENEEEEISMETSVNPIQFQAPTAPKQVNLFDFVSEVSSNEIPEVELESVPFRLLEKEELQFTVINKTAEPSEEDRELEDQMKRNKERIARLKELSMKLRTPSGLNDLENEPAYLRKKQNLDSIPHSSESQISRYTLGEENGETQIKPNNTFLHDNVD